MIKNHIVQRVMCIGSGIRNYFSAIRRYTLYAIRVTPGFTLLETMVAVTLLSVAIVAPMSLTAQSLASAYYARDEITAFYLAQEGLESVRNARDNNILLISQGGSSTNLLSNIPTSGPFRVDSLDNNTMTLCSQDALPGGACRPLYTDGTLYGYTSSQTVATQFTRTLTACYIQSDGTCNGNATDGSGNPIDEIKVTSAVSWRTQGIQARSVTLSENLYRWVADNSAGT